GAWVRNGGEVVEKVMFSVEGDAATWTQVEPSEVGLFPKQKGEVQVVFRPPRAWQVRSGPTPFRLVATSQSDETVVYQVQGPGDGDSRRGRLRGREGGPASPAVGGTSRCRAPSGVGERRQHRCRHRRPAVPAG